MRAVHPLVVALAAVALGFACDRSPTGVPQPPAGSPAPTGPLASRSKPHHALKLVLCRHLPPHSVTQVIGPAGGSISVGPHTLLIPAGALKKTVAITAVIAWKLKEFEAEERDVWVNAVHFSPRLRFQRPVYLTMSYVHCAVGDRASLPKQVVYTNEANNIILEEEDSNDNPDAQTVTASIDHFSNYAVAW